MKIALFGPSLGTLLSGAVAGPVVAVQDDETEVVAHWTPPGLPEGTACYFGRYRGRFLLYERTSGLSFPTQRCTYPQSHTDGRGDYKLGPAQYTNPGDERGFVTLAKAKCFYLETNPEFEAAHPECSTLRYLVEQLQLRTGQTIMEQGYADAMRRDRR